MTLSRTMMGLGVLFAASIAAAPALSPADFAVRLPVQAQPGAGVQRLEVPAQALVASRSPGLADLRLFDARGQSLPIARLEARDAAVQGAVKLTALPILGRPGALRVTGVALTLDERKGSRVARIDGTVDPATEAVVLGNLFDTRKVKERATGLQLDADLPTGQPVMVIVEASANLRDWEMLGEKMFYRASAEGENEPVDLGNASLDARYLRVRWRADAPLVGPVVIRGATLQTQTAAPARPLHSVRLDSLVQTNAHEILLSLPFATPVEAIDIEPARVGVLVPVTVYGRENEERPWVRLGVGTVFRLPEDGKVRESTRVPLNAGPTAHIRIESDSRMPGFETLPKVEALLSPVWMAFVASGSPPYELAVGRKSAEAAWLPMTSLIPADRDEESLPLAKSPIFDGQVTVSASPESEWPKNRILLWGVLILATASLAVMVLKLRKR